MRRKQNKQKTDILARLKNEQTIEYEGIKIVVRKLPRPDCPPLLCAIVLAVQEAPENEQDEAMFQRVLSAIEPVLDACMEIPDDPEIRIRDLPADCVALIAETFLTHCFDLGNFLALGRTLGEKFGVNLNSLTQGKLSEKRLQG